MYFNKKSDQRGLVHLKQNHLVMKNNKEASQIPPETCYLYLYLCIDSSFNFHNNPIK